jgi:hypothetical protein
MRQRETLRCDQTLFCDREVFTFTCIPDGLHHRDAQIRELAWPDLADDADLRALCHIWFSP